MIYTGILCGQLLFNFCFVYLSKFLEKLIYSKLILLLINYNVILLTEYGFRSKVSTSDALLNDAYLMLVL